jgi:hypothetical protein
MPVVVLRASSSLSPSELDWAGADHLAVAKDFIASANELCPSLVILTALVCVCGGGGVGRLVHGDHS